MSAIFKARKVPKHLIIQDEAQFFRRSRFSLLKLAVWGVLLLLVTGMVLVGAQLGLQLLQTQT